MTNDFLGNTQYTVGFLKGRSDSDFLELTPGYQRNKVWLTPQKSYLIDTILHGYPIPELYIQETMDDSGETKYSVVDGQQRIRACLEFIEGRYSLALGDDSIWDGLKFDDLSLDQRKKIMSYKFVVRPLPGMSEQQIREIFKRLNKNNVILNNQELRHATYWGEFITMIDELANREFWVESAIFTANDFRRMLDREYLSELAIGYLHGPQNKKTTLDKWYQAYEELFEERRHVERVFDAVTGEIAQVLPDLKKHRWVKKSDFYTLFLVLAEHHDRLPLSSDQRAELRTKLAEFGAQVDAHLSKRGGVRLPGATAPLVYRYSDAVERAASDLGNRRARAEQLKSLLAFPLGVAESTTSALTY